MTLEDIRNSNSITDLVKNGGDEYPDTYGKKLHRDRFEELSDKFANYPVELAAMQDTIRKWLQTIKAKVDDITKLSNESEREKELQILNKLLDEDPIIFLNRHDKSHTLKVFEKALELIKCFNGIEFSRYEIYFLACAIVVHDIGNIYGRAEHEKKISDILDNECTSIIPDSVERRIISRIAGVHGGKIYGNSDTISVLSKEASVNGFRIKEQLLAAILRFADELADDKTRANYDAMIAGILGSSSEIYHIYSEKLHTVRLQQNSITKAYEVFLAYQFDSSVAKTLYEKAGQKIYLLDEIYSRTIKMERERRYCIRYLRPYCSLESIRVEIVVTIDTFNEEKIPYTLEEKGYPASPFSSIKDVKNDILSGEELAKKL